MWETILSIVMTVLTVVVTVISYYLSVKKLIQEEALKAINIAEELDLIGEEKMAVAVESVYSVLPAPAKAFISKAMIQVTVQAVFDQVKEFAEKQVKG